MTRSAAVPASQLILLSMAVRRFAPQFRDPKTANATMAGPKKLSNPYKGRNGMRRAPVTIWSGSGRISSAKTMQMLPSTSHGLDERDTVEKVSFAAANIHMMGAVLSNVPTKLCSGVGDVRLA